MPFPFRNCLVTGILLAICGQALSEDLTKVVHVYVIRRDLDKQPFPSVKSYAHSALLLTNQDGSTYVLEFMSDARAHLTKVEQKVLSTNDRKSVASITAEGWTSEGIKVFTWERQLKGIEIAPKWTPEELRDAMESGMEALQCLGPGALSRSPRKAASATGRAQIGRQHLRLAHSGTGCAANWSL